MKSFRDYLKSKDYFEKLDEIISNIEDMPNNAGMVNEIDQEDIENLTDTEDIDKEVDNAQEDASNDKKSKNTDDTETETEEPEEDLSEKNKKIEKQSFKDVLKSPFLESLNRLCKPESFNNISNNKKNGFEIPDDKQSISFSSLATVSCGYQISFAEFEQDPQIQGDISKINEVKLLDTKSVASLSSDYFGISFYPRTDFVITDTNTDNYADKLFNDVAEELRKTNKLTFEYFKTAVLNKLKTNQNIDDDVIIGYMKVYNFANHISKRIVDKYCRNKKIPIIISDKENLMLDEIKKLARKK